MNFNKLTFQSPRIGILFSRFLVVVMVWFVFFLVVILPLIPESESFKLCLWNPATKQIRQLPNTRNESETIRTIGFGYDSNTNDYKVVIINYFDDDDDAFYDNFRVFQAEMYSLSTGCWKKIKSDVDFQDMFMEDSSVTVNGMLFWRVEEEEYQFVLSFDMGKEEFRIIVMPDSIEYCYRIAKFKDSLVLLSEFYEDAGLGWAVSVDLWVMEHNCDGGQSWSKLFTVGTFYKINCPVGIWKNEIFIQGYKYTEEESGMLLCNPTNNEMKILTDIGSAHLYDVFNYVESLVPV
ncbi:putative F-box family protein [Quillaja saponaria]|uniref:F-box family protein n=1 Tax=Quillaja saponaria TaxID=32244 RepID=A0AAD7LQ12_QUISA|nr:putative F-box family protein [Quillaja saponaria]